MSPPHYWFPQIFQGVTMNKQTNKNLPLWCREDEKKSVSHSNFGDKSVVWTKAYANRPWFETTVGQVEKALKELRPPVKHDIQFTETEKEILDNITPRKGVLLQSHVDDFKLEEKPSISCYGRSVGKTADVTSKGLRDIAFLYQGNTVNFVSTPKELREMEILPSVRQKTSVKQEKKSKPFIFSSQLREEEPEATPEVEVDEFFLSYPKCDDDFFAEIDDLPITPEMKMRYKPYEVPVLPKWHEKIPVEDWLSANDFGVVPDESVEFEEEPMELEEDVYEVPELYPYDWYCDCSPDVLSLMLYDYQYNFLLEYYCQDPECALTCSLYHGCPRCLPDFYDLDDNISAEVLVEYHVWELPEFEAVIENSYADWLAVFRAKYPQLEQWVSNDMAARESADYELGLKALKMVRPRMPQMGAAARTFLKHPAVATVNHVGMLPRPVIKESASEIALIMLLKKMPAYGEDLYMLHKNVPHAWFYMHTIVEAVCCRLQVIYRDQIIAMKQRITCEMEVSDKETVSTEENVTFTDEREIQGDTGILKSQVEVTHRPLDMQESEWHVRNVMAKPLRFDRIAWSTAQSTNSIVKRWTIPGDVTKGVHFQMMEQFLLFRGHPKLRIQVNGTKFHAGRLIFAFIPVYANAGSSEYFYTTDVLTSFPHIMLDASASNTGVLSLPFSHMNSYFMLDRPESITSGTLYLGTLECRVFNHLNATTAASQQIDVTMWISWDKCELHQPCLSHDLVFPVFPENPSAEMAVDNKEIERLVPNAVTSLNFGDGVNRIDRLSLSHNSQLVASPMISAGSDEMNLLSLLKIPTRLRTIEWKTSEAAGAMLAGFVVYPSVNVNKTNTATHSIYDMTLLSYVSRAFKYWRGSLNYRIEVVASAMQSGRLHVMFAPSIFPDSDDADNVMNVYVIDLQEQHEVSFTVPYMSHRPWLRCDRLYPDLDFSGVFQTPWESPGTLCIRVLNRLVCPEANAQAVEVNVFVSAGEDFELAFPTDLTYLMQDHLDLPNRITAEMETQINPPRVQEKGVVLSKGGSLITSPAKVTMGENAMDLRKVLQRHMLIYDIETSVSAERYLVFNNSPYLGDKSYLKATEAMLCRTHLAHFSNMFTFWRGSLKYKLVWMMPPDSIITNEATEGDPDFFVSHNAPTTMVVTVYHTPGLYMQGSITDVHASSDDEKLMLSQFEIQGAMVASSKIQGSMEFEIPFYTTFNQLQTQPYLSGSAGKEAYFYNAYNSTGTVYIKFKTISNTNLVCNLKLYQAAGEDFQLSYFKGVPRLLFRAGWEEIRKTHDTCTNLYEPSSSKSTTKEEEVGDLVVKKIGKSTRKISPEFLIDNNQYNSHTSVPFPRFMLKKVSAPKPEMFAAVKSLISTPQKVNDTMEAVQSTCGKVSEVLDASGLTKGDDDSDDPDDNGNPVQLALSVLADFLQDGAAKIGIASKITSYAVTVANLVSGFNSFLVATNIAVKACAIVTIVSELFGTAVNFIKSKLYTIAENMLLAIANGNKKGNELPEAEILFLDFAPALLATFGVGAAAIGWKHIPSDKETNELIKNINDRLRLFNSSSLAMTNIKKLWAELKGMIEWITDWLLGLFAPEILAQLKLERGFADIDTWASRVEELYNTDYVARANFELDFRIEVGQLEARGKEINTLLLQGKIGREASLVREYVKKSVEMAQKVRNAHRQLPFRIDPFCICIFGQTRARKSTCVQQMLHRVMDAFGIPHGDHICPVNCNAKHFTEHYNEGDSEHHAVNFEDFMTTNNEEQINHFQCLKGNNKWVLDMAFRKGTTFVSWLIGMTTNTPWPSPNCMLHPATLRARRNLLIEQEFIPGHPPQGCAGCGYNFAHTRFRFVDPLENNAAHRSPWYNYEQTVAIVIEECIRYIRAQEELVRRMLVAQGFIPPPGIAPPIPMLPGEEPEDEPPAPIIPVWDAARGIVDQVREENAQAADEMIDAIIEPAPVPEIGLKFNPRINMAKLQENVLLSLYVDDGIYENLEWVKMDNHKLGGAYGLKDAVLEDENIRVQWMRLQENFKERNQDVQDMLYSVSETGMLSAAKNQLDKFKGFLIAKWTKAKEDHPWLAIMETWPIKIAAALIVLGGALGFATKVVHSCICATVRHFGYRCPKCGKWPKLENCADKAWLVSEWKAMYGETANYESGRITTMKEEADFSELASGARAEKIFQGTKEKRTVEGGPYSQDVKGLKISKVFAQAGPYSQDVKGLGAQRVMANNGQRTEDLIQHRIAKCLYRIRGTVSGHPASMNCFAVGARYVLIPRHFMDLIDEEKFEIYHNGVWLSINKDPRRSTSIANKDLIVYEMPVQFHQHRSMLNHFISEQDLGKVKSTQGYLIKRLTPEELIMMECERITSQRSVKYAFEDNGQCVEFVVQDAWKYSSPKSNGACGSVLMTTSDKVGGQILGLHVAGNGLHGWSQLITKEMLAPFLERKPQLGTPIPAAVGSAKLEPEGHFGMVGEVKNGVYQSKKSEIIPTAIHGLIRAPVTAPSVLANNDERLERPTNVMRKAIEKYGKPPKDFNTDDVEAVLESLKAEVEQWTLQRDPKILTREEAVLGIPDFEGFERLPLNTSPGYPYVLSRPRGEMGKAYLFDVNGKITNKELETNFEARLALAKKGERSASIWTCCLKDERRSLKKIALGSTRLFVIPPVDLSLMTRMYTLDFTVAVKDNRSNSFCKVGMDPQSLEWTELYNYLAEYSNIVIAGDYGRFDGSLPPQLAFAFADLQYYFYSYHGNLTPAELEELRRALTVMADEGVHTVMIAGKSVFVKHIGNNSGDPTTVIKNSVVNYFYIALSWLALARVYCPECATMSAFRRYVRMANYGDDNDMAVKAEVLSWFNQETIAAFLANYGIEYTNAEKTGITKSLPLDKSTFLKNGFGNHESLAGIKVPLMAKDTIYELLNWTRPAPDQDELLESNCNDALRFAYFYGVAFFNELRVKIVNALRQKEIKLDIMTYNDFHYWFLFVIGKLPRISETEMFFERVSKNGNGKLAKFLGCTLTALPYYLVSWTGMLQTEKRREASDDRYAIAIPSGEGKSWLCKNFPKLFVDHDELLLPEAHRLLKKHGVEFSHLKKMFDLEFPRTDRRILLCHHPDNTRRKILGCFVLPKPNFIRANAFQRLRLRDPERMERSERNWKILDLVKNAEPALWKMHVANDDMQQGSLASRLVL